MKEEISTYLEKFTARGRTRALLAREDYISFLRQAYADAESEREAAFRYLHGIEDRPVCKACGGSVSFFGTRFAKTCSRACDVNSRDLAYRTENAKRLRDLACDKEMKSKRHETNLKRYGSGQSPEVREAASKRSATLNEKGRATLLQRYGSNSPLKAPGALAKARQTRNKNADANLEARLGRLQSNFDAMAPEHVTSVSLPTGDEANVRLDIKCHECNEAFVLPSETLKFRLRKIGRACHICGGLSTATSFDERLLGDMLESWGLDVIRNDRKLIHPYELDIYIPSRKMAIEYCGLFWHSERAGKEKNYHRRKLDLCEDTGTKLITIFEDEWITKRPIVESMLQNQLGMPQRIIHARKCEVRAITAQIGRRFIGENHIQGGGRARVYYGLYLGDEIVAVMSFSKHELSRKGTGWDINRFCTLLNTRVHGGASKLFAQFVRDCDPAAVVSYADLRYGTGSVYEHMGFTLENRTVTNYWYFKGNDLKRYHRFGLRKNSQDNPELTEWENRQKAGWNRIWDCGHAKWVWRK